MDFKIWAKKYPRTYVITASALFAPIVVFGFIDLLDFIAEDVNHIWAILSAFIVLCYFLTYTLLEERKYDKK